MVDNFIVFNMTMCLQKKKKKKSHKSMLSNGLLWLSNPFLLR